MFRLALRYFVAIFLFFIRLHSFSNVVQQIQIRNIMATVKLILRTHQADKTGAAPLYIRVIKDRKTKFISTGYKFLPTQWNPVD